MDFEQFLEKDILFFLDSRTTKKDRVKLGRDEEYGLYITKDYLKELNHALDNDELTKAKTLFDELKKKYSELPKNGIERKNTYALLEKMYEKIQNYVNIKEGKIEIIREGTSEIQKRVEKFDEKNKVSKDGTTVVNVQVQPIVRMDTLPIRSNNGIQVRDPDDESNGKIQRKRGINASVESNILQNSIKDSNTKENGVNDSNTTEKSITDSKNQEEEKSELPIEKDHTEQKHSHSIRRKELSDDEERAETIDEATELIEEIKSHISDRLLRELHKKLEEQKTEQEQLIENIRKDMIQRMNVEMEKAYKDGNFKTDIDMDKVHDEILQNVYSRAGQLLSSNENNNYLEKGHAINQMNTKHKSVHTPIPKIILYNDKRSDISEKPNTHNIKHKHGDKEIQMLYEEAIYTMLQNNYVDAAKLFKQILQIRPDNKAAKIRLYECNEAMLNV